MGVAENSERYSMTPTYIHKLNLWVNMSYNMRHALNIIFCLLSVSYLVGELSCCLHTTVILTVCYIYRQPGRWYHYSKQMLAAKAPQAINRQPARGYHYTKTNVCLLGDIFNS